jgi:hypothetical protein
MKSIHGLGLAEDYYVDVTMRRCAGDPATACSHINLAEFSCGYVFVSGADVVFQFILKSCLAREVSSRSDIMLALARSLSFNI